MTATIIFLILLVLILVFFVFKKFSKSPMVENNEKILVLTDQNFQNAIKNQTILIDFWAEWCMPCKMMAPILNDVAKELPEGQVVGKVDIEVFPALAQKYGIRNIPTLVLFKNGKELERIVGVKSKDFLLKKMKNS